MLRASKVLFMLKCMININKYITICNLTNLVNLNKNRNLEF